MNNFLFYSLLWCVYLCLCVCVVISTNSWLDIMKWYSFIPFYALFSQMCHCYAKWWFKWFFFYFTVLISRSLIFFPLSLVCLFFRFFGAHYFSMICSLGFGWLSVYDTNYTTKFMDMNEIPKQRTSRMKLLIFIEIASRYLCCFFAFFSLSFRSSHFRCDDNNSDFAVAVGASVFLARWLWKMISTMNNINHNGPPIYFVVLQSMEKTCT